MTALRQRMLEDLRIRNYAPTTVACYIRSVAEFAQHFNKPPDQLGPEEIRSWQLFLLSEKRVKLSTYIQAVCALRFFYQNTLHRRIEIDRIPLPRYEKKLPVIAFVEDVAASGGYMIACAADEIVCDPASIVGSIGVIGATFGFPEAIKKLGIERRVYTAGEHKSTLDPFLAENEDDVARLKAIQRDIHSMFIGLVRERRGERLTGPEDAVFSGEYWVAKTAKDLGLVDQLGDVRGFLRQRFGEDVVTPPVPAERSLFGRRTPGVAGIATEGLLGIEPHGLVDDLISALEARAIWARFGL